MSGGNKLKLVYIFSQFNNSYLQETKFLFSEQMYNYNPYLCFYLYLK